MSISTLATALSALVLFSTGAAAQSRYVLTDQIDNTNFFTEFEFFSAPDPTHGFVTYSTAQTANISQLAGFVDLTAVFLGADHTTVNPTAGRLSTRVSSIKTWTHGLFLADIAHMPSSTCGVWPAYWLVGPNWPYDGEIDILEGVHTASADTMTLHTSAGCTVTADGSAAGTSPPSNGGNCNAANANDGCGVTAAAPNTYGDDFNAAGGGVYATEWTSAAISIWFFPRSAIPADITADTPNPAGWGRPIARFNGGAGCTLDQHFRNHSIVFDTTFCGDWAGNVWSQYPECTALAPTCNQYVAANPEAFARAYFLINSIQVYKQS